MDVDYLLESAVLDDWVLGYGKLGTSTLLQY